MNQGQFNSKLVYQYLHDIGIESIGKEITLRARLNKVRSTSKRCFLELRQQDHSIQGLVEQDESFVKFCSSVKPESLVFIKGKIQSAYQPIKSCSISNLELSIDSLFVERAVTLKLPILPNDQSKLDTRLDNRVLDLRSPLNQSIFKIQSLFCKEFRQFLNQQGFTEIHTPKLTSSSSEGGSNVFQVSYFKSMYLDPNHRKCILGSISSII